MIGYRCFCCCFLLKFVFCTCRDVEMYIDSLPEKFKGPGKCQLMNFCNHVTDRARSDMKGAIGIFALGSRQPCRIWYSCLMKRTPRSAFEAGSLVQFRKDVHR